jgi:hypothetical protein
LDGHGQAYCRRAAFWWLVAEAAWDDRVVTVSGKLLRLQRGQLRTLSAPGASRARGRCGPALPPWPDLLYKGGEGADDLHRFGRDDGAGGR